MTRILFPTDFTQASVDSLLETLEFINGFNAELIIFHAYSRPYDEKKQDFNQQQQLEKLEKSIDQEFEQLRKKVTALASTNYRFVKSLGSSVETIVNAVDSENVHLLIMHTEGATGLGELWGTKTARIVKQLHIPMIVVPSGAKLTQLNKIALACDFSKNTSYEKVSMLVAIAKQKNLEIHIVTLNRIEKTMTADEEDHRMQLQQLMNGVKSNIEFTSHKYVKEGLIDYCKSNDVGLLAILPKSYSYIERAFHESLTVSMTFNSPVPLLVLK